MAELAAVHDRYPHELFDYPDAGHGIGFLLPNYPGLAVSESMWGSNEGNRDVSNALARVAQWPKVLAFLRN
jgi:hypothetical protein